MLHHDGYGVYGSNENEVFRQFENQIDGIYYFNATAEDNETNINYTETRNVTVDLTYPIINYAELTDNGTIDREYIIINLTANDTYLNNITINIYNSTFDNINQTVTDQTEFLLNYSDNIIDGETYYFNATACDKAGNCNNTIETWNVTININTNAAPYIILNTPLNDSYHNESMVIINISIYDDDLNNMTLYIYGDDVLINTTENEINGTEITYEWNTAGEGIHNWTAIANDGTENSTNGYYYFTIDTIYPSIEIVSPQNITYDNATVLINISSDGDNTWFFNGTDNETYTIPTYITFPEGNNTIYAYTNDTAGNFNMTEVTFYINTTSNATNNTAPTITINSPANDSYTNIENITLNLTIYDDDLDNMTAWFYGDSTSLDTRENQTNGTEIIYEWTTPSEGIHNWSIILDDGTENSTYGYYYFTIDTTAPVITFNQPSSNPATSNSSSIIFNITVSESYLRNITFTIYNSTGSLINSTIQNTSESTITISDLSNGTYYYNATAYDIAGNSNITDTRNITVNTTTVIIVPPPDDGGDDGGGGRGSRGGGGRSTYFPTINLTSNTSGEDSMKIYWSTLPAGNRVITNEKKDIPIDSLTILLINNTNNRSYIEIYSKNNNPYKEEIKTKIFKYVIINTSINESNVEKLEIKFRVDKKWLEENNISREEIILYEYNKSNPGWTPINTSKGNEDTSYVYYSSISTQLSSLAIGQIEKPVIKPITNTSTSGNSNQTIEKIVGESISVNTDEKIGLFKSIGQALFGTGNSTRSKISEISINKDTQFSIIVIISSVMMLIVGIVSGVLIFRNLSAKKELEQDQTPVRKLKVKKIISYIEEPSSASKVVSTVSISKNESASKPLPSPDVYIRKIDQLLLQSEYALDSGKLEDAKKYYSEAKSIYLNSRLDYEHKSKIYDKIMILSGKLNRK